MPPSEPTLWDPEPAGRADPAFAGHTFTVSELSAVVRGALDSLFPGEVWVEGEIASLSNGRTRGGSPAGPSGTPGARHVYFDLVEPADHDRVPGTAAGSGAVLPVVLFDTARRRVNQTLKTQGAVKMTDGVRVRIRGRLDLYAPQSRLQLRMSSIDPLYTVAVLQSARDRVLAALSTERLLDRNRSLPMPRVPACIGLVTSHGSAAEADFLHELEASGLVWQVVAADAPMQGVEAPTRIAAALLHLDRLGRCDVIALVRGGGARTDLAAFDSELVARTIATLGTPVVTGIGHETDTAVADAVAAVASKTPTACAAGITARAAEWTARASAVEDAIAPAAMAALTRADQHHARLAERAGATAEARLAMTATRLDHVEARLTERAIGALDREVHRLAGLAGTVRALDPQRTLERGFSITRTVDGTLVRATTDAPPGTGLVTATADGTVASTVDAAPPGD